MNHRVPRVAACAWGLIAFWACLAPAHAEAPPDKALRPPLHVRVDEILKADRIAEPAPLASDAEFLRRASLDLTGMPPSVVELKAFLADRAPEKRAAAVDRLIASPRFARHWAKTLDLMLMERRRHQNVSREEWDAYLLEAARENRPLNELMAELIRADGAAPEHRAAARFCLDRDADPNLITRDVGRIFFGRDMQCAHCHDHPIVDDYLQSDYYGLLAFFSSSYVINQQQGKKKVAVYAEKPGAELPFDSVFVKDDHHLTGPRVLGGTELAEPVYPPGDEYRVKPAGATLPVPRHSRRAELAALATGGQNRAFNENLANRLWAAMMGRGLVHPVDLLHPENPPVDPKLLKFLGEELAARHFNAREFLRELALTETYQRGIDPPERAPSPAGLAERLAGSKKRLEALKSAAERSRNDHDAAIKAWHKAEEGLLPLAAAVDKAVAAHTAASAKRNEASQALGTLQAKIQAGNELARALADAAARGRDVARKLPKEKSLADAAQTFEKRAAAATAEQAALQKTVAGKTDALKKADEALAAAVKTVDAARTAAKPVHEAVRQKESLEQIARQKMASGRLAAEDLRNRVALLEAYARRDAADAKAAAAAKALESGRAALQAAQKQAADHAPSLQKARADRAAAENARAAAVAAEIKARAELDHHQKVAASVAAASAAIETAQGLLPGDQELAEAAQKLEVKSKQLQTAAAAPGARAEAASAALLKAGLALEASKKALDAASAEKARRGRAVAAATAALDAEGAKVKGLESERDEANADLVTLLGNRFAIAQIKPLTPEQFCWSVLKVTGVYDRYRAIEAAALEKAGAAKPPRPQTAAEQGPRAREIEQKTFEKLKGNVPAFVRVFGAGPGQPQSDFFATADQALFAANGGSINSWIAPAGGNVSQRAVEEKNPRAAAEDLYLTVLSRPPTADEAADVARLLDVPAKDKPAVVQELVWGLITSAEFRFNH